ncbi:MAG TPA: TlyA family RNA methyltransferase [Epulopiscium sp.]|nr:TlyA family RNA methyltransferase [Candidatus Epulonipiscium sp.]
MAKRERLDVLITQRELTPSREKAKAYIMAGVVYVNGQKEDKPGCQTKPDAVIEIREKMKYVSRGGYKLEKAMAVFPITLEDKVTMDVGASTGGFTDCMLQNGASKVYAVDVGYGQFAWKLRQDPRVVCMEKTNMRYLTRVQIENDIEFASIDVSFISLSKIIGPLQSLLTQNGEIVALIKPQFEAGREKVGKKGVVRDPKVHEEVIEKVLIYAREIGFGVHGIDFSPIKGPEGNIEYLVYLKNNIPGIDVDQQDEMIKRIVQQSHEMDQE